MPKQCQVRSLRFDDLRNAARQRKKGAILRRNRKFEFAQTKKNTYISDCNMPIFARIALQLGGMYLSVKLLRRRVREGKDFGTKLVFEKFDGFFITKHIKQTNFLTY